MSLAVRVQKWHGGQLVVLLIVIAILALASFSIGTVISKRTIDEREGAGWRAFDSVYASLPPSRRYEYDHPFASTYASAPDATMPTPQSSAPPVSPSTRNNEGPETRLRRYLARLDSLPSPDSILHATWQRQRASALAYQSVQDERDRAFALARQNYRETNGTEVFVLILAVPAWLVAYGLYLTWVWFGYRSPGRVDP
jgi:hypothetical protein